MFKEIKVRTKIITVFLLVTAIALLTGVVGYMGMDLQMLAGQFRLSV